jgi:hypothetical protein
VTARRFAELMGRGGSISASFGAPMLLPLLEPSSTSSNSQPRKVWASTAATASPRKRPSPRKQTMTPDHARLRHQYAPQSVRARLFASQSPTAMRGSWNGSVPARTGPASVVHEARNPASRTSAAVSAPWLPKG